MYVDATYMIFDICIDCEMNSILMFWYILYIVKWIIKLITTSPHSYFCFFVRTLKIYSLGRFSVWNTLLLTDTRLYIRYSEFIVYDWNFVLFDQYLSTTSAPRPPTPHILFTLYSLQLTILNSTYKWLFYRFMKFADF